MTYKYLFGPVPSRRLGMSLGIDLIPYKVCNCNCIYCESGKTTKQTNTRAAYFPESEIKEELIRFLASNPTLDYLTFSGAGEPTLHKGLGNMISFLKTNYPEYKIALITNSLLMTDAEVRREIRVADVILPSLDAISEEAFQKINRPLSNNKAIEIAEALADFRKEYTGQIWMEVFLLPGINDHPQELKLLKEALLKIKPDKVQLNTLDRPGTETSLKAVPFEIMLSIRDYFLPLPVEIISRKPHELKETAYKEEWEEEILTLIRRRPCTMDDLLLLTSLPYERLDIMLKKMCIARKIITDVQGGVTFYLSA